MLYLLYAFVIIPTLTSISVYAAYEELTELKNALHAAQEKINDSVTSLKTSYTHTQREIIHPLETTVTYLKDQITRLHQAHTLSKATGEILKGLSTIALLVPGLATASSAALLLFADVPIIIDASENTLIAIQDTIGSIKNRIAHVNHELDPRSDPKGLYEHFKKARTHFKRALDSIDALQAHTPGA